MKALSKVEYTLINTLLISSLVNTLIVSLRPLFSAGITMPRLLLFPSCEDDKYVCFLKVCLKGQCHVIAKDGVAEMLPSVISPAPKREPIVLNRHNCPCSQQQGSSNGCRPLSHGCIWTSALFPYLWVPCVYLCVSVSVLPPSSWLPFSNLPPSRSELLSSTWWRQCWGQVVCKWREQGRVRAVQPVYSRGSWVSFLWRGFRKHKLPVGVSFEEIDGACRGGSKRHTDQISLQ